ncbi:MULTISPECIES: nitrate reductase molybdenum cofactor assembly chaperone [Hoeflea]|uniref:Nitrate reductase molybdenum cofactor assembly chaperone n=1 Tax=Hoeflea algicola TaxID=2983763 RepID=A0ABT3Z6J4_9HYPH|nr:nitrate reductase molybdenum cofactor assembly chaperone [Hoeflea algicola]MCY0147362.1 nitrate reductase molybdenum cofactor assembly chaperone [Hoeflea algicola]
MTRTFKALSALLTYPSTELQEAIPAIREVFASEPILTADAVAAIEPLLAEFESRDIYDLQERYVLLFDRSRTLSLNLFEHIHGEGRDRGGAMVDLLETYRAEGFDLVGTELPDHLPVLLEFASTLPLPAAREILADAGHIIAVLAERLTRRETPYAAVLTGLSQVAQASTETEVAQALLSEQDDDPEDLEALDAVYEEAMVTFGPDPNAGCPITRDILARMDVPARPANA